MWNLSPACDRASLSGAHACVVGAGLSGIAAARLLLREGAIVTLIDEREQHRPAMLPDSVFFLSGAPATAHLAACSGVVVISPGVPTRKPILDDLRARGVPVIGELELASWFITCPLVAITGTNGKSTVTSLLGDIMTAANRNPFTGGNLGTPLAELPLDLPSAGIAVVEASSFQLETIQHFRADIAAILNIAPDHLDRYDTMASYAAAKARLFETQSPDDFALVRAIDAQNDWARTGRAQRAWVGFDDAAFAPGPRAVITRETASAPARIAIEFGARHVLEVANPALIAPHNLENTAFAALAAILAGVPFAAIETAVRNFTALPFRFIDEGYARGMRFINDSKATNVAAAAKAIQGTAGPLILLLGGVAKEDDFSPLVAAAQKRIARTYVFGQDAARIAPAFAHEAELIAAETLAAAVAHVASHPIANATVLLAPACASFDQFTGYRQRGELFRRLVRELQQSSTAPSNGAGGASCA